MQLLLVKKSKNEFQVRCLSLSLFSVFQQFLHIFRHFLANKAKSCMLKWPTVIQLNFICLFKLLNTNAQARHIGDLFRL